MESYDSENWCIGQSGIVKVLGNATMLRSEGFGQKSEICKKYKFISVIKSVKFHICGTKNDSLALLYPYSLASN